MKISVLTPSYNSGKYLERAIDSVISQNYSSYEHIIMDGGSKDNTLDILKKYDHLVWVSEPDKGQSDAMNKAFKKSTGDIIVYLNADDEFAPGAFNEIVKAFTNFPKVDMVVGNLTFTDPDGSTTRVPSHKYLDILQYWKNRFPNNPVSYFYRRSVQERIGDFPLTDHYSMDVWFLLKAYHKFKVVKIDKLLGVFHSDGFNKTAVTDTGHHLHQAVKGHLKNDNKMLMPYFYYKLLLGRVKK